MSDKICKIKILLSLRRRNGRVVDCGGLENRCPGDWTGGSNPSFSAKTTRSSPAPRGFSVKYQLRNGFNRMRRWYLTEKTFGFDLVVLSISPKGSPASDGNPYQFFQIYPAPNASQPMNLNGLLNLDGAVSLVYHSINTWLVSQKHARLLQWGPPISDNHRCCF